MFRAAAFAIHTLEAHLNPRSAQQTKRKIHWNIQQFAFVSEACKFMIRRKSFSLRAQVVTLTLNTICVNFILLCSIATFRGAKMIGRRRFDVVFPLSTAKRIRKKPSRYNKMKILYDETSKFQQLLKESGAYQWIIFTRLRRGWKIAGN